MDTDRAARAIDDFLRAIGRDPDREPELRGTGARVADAYRELTSGYEVDVAALLRDNLIEQGGGTIALRDVAVTTTCPHHLMPASGTAIIAYEPAGRILGVGAIPRALDAFSRRLALQEEIGENVADAIFGATGARWVMCRLHMSHACMTARGDRRHGATLVTVSVRGDRDAAARAMGALS